MREEFGKLLPVEGGSSKFVLIRAAFISAASMTSTPTDYNHFGFTFICAATRFILAHLLS